MCSSDLAQVQEEEEVIQDISSDEEDTPAMNTREKKRKCVNSREYIKRFKMWLERPPVILVPLCEFYLVSLSLKVLTYQNVVW